MTVTVNPKNVYDASTSSSKSVARSASKSQDKDVMEICKIILPVGIAATLGIISLMCAVCAKAEKLKEQRAVPQKIVTRPTVDTNTVQAVQKTGERQNQGE